MRSFKLATTAQSRSVRIFRNGRSQAIRIPREFSLPGDEAIISRDRKGRLIVEASRKRTVTELLDSWEPLDEKDAMPEIKDYLPEPFDL